MTKTPARDPRRSKPLGVRRRELSDAAVLLREARHRVLKGERQHALTISAQLRALLTQSDSNKPLLFEMATMVGKPLECFGISLHVDLHSPQVKIGGDPLGVAAIQRFVSLVPTGQSPGHRMPFQQWLKSEFCTVEIGSTGTTTSITFEDLIRLHANRLGGAHYDSVWTVVDQHIQRVRLRFESQVTMIEALLVDTSEITEWFIADLCAELDEYAFALLESAVSQRLELPVCSCCGRLHNHRVRIEESGAE